jgi:glycosyltransferase involved in cell wall biosynthesis
MRIGIFNQNLPVMGGGEQYMGAVAEHLSRTHEVELLSYNEVNLDLLKERLGIDLTHLPLKTFPALSGYRSIQDASTNYDLFINCTYEGLFPAYACHNLYLGFFPHKLPPREEAIESEKNEINGKVNFQLLSGFFPPEMDAKGEKYRWCGESSQIHIDNLEPGRSYNLSLEVGGFRQSKLPPANLQLLLNGRKLDNSENLPPNSYTRLTRQFTAQSEQAVLRLDCTTFAPAHFGVEDGRELGVVIRAISVVPNSLISRFTKPELLVNRKDSQLPGMQAHYSLDTYQDIISISEYTRKWVQNRWGRESYLLYPRVQIDKFKQMPKKRQLLAVGRFFAGFHNKKHLPLIRAFRRMCDNGLSGYEFHLAGGYYPKRPEDEEYMAQVRTEAKGYPIYIHPNIDSDHLNCLYAESMVFWHATGLDEDDDNAPELFEHFGITTVEAMASGCVPVVIDKAGQREVVRHADNGYLWNCLEDCISNTLKVLENEPLREKLSAKAIETSRNFGTDRFKHDLDEIMGWILSRPLSKS